MARTLQFPTVAEVTQDNPLVWRDREQIVRLYNSSTKPKKKAKNLTAAIEAWVRTTAHAAGWAGVTFPLKYPSHTLKAGAVFQK